MGNLTLSSFFMLIISILLGSFGQICLKIGLNNNSLSISTSIYETLINLLSIIFTPWVILGFTLYALSTLTWLLLISRVRLSIAYPMLSISYVVVMILSVVILHENVNLLYGALGLISIGVGVTFVGLGMNNIDNITGDK